MRETHGNTSCALGRLLLGNVYIRDHPDHSLLSPLELAKRELDIRSTVIWTDPQTLEQKGNSVKAQQGRRTLKAQYEHFVRDWADKKFGNKAYVRIR